MPVASRPAYVALLVTAALWGSNAVVARGLLDVVSPPQLAFARWLVVLACLAPLAWTERAPIVQALRHDLGTCAALALLGFGPQTLLTYTALAHTTAVVVGLLNSAIPVLIVAIAALAYAFLRESLHAYHAAGFVLVAGGALLCCLAPAPILSSPPARRVDAAAHP